MANELERLPLVDVRVRVEDLCLWPQNPRLRVVDDDDGMKLDIADPRLQSRILEEMSKPEFEIEELMDSIRAKGFVNVDSIFVRKMGDSGKYLVLEGNRRTTALKKLLNRPEESEPKLLAAIREIPAKELAYDGSDDADDNVDFILGIRHHGGIKQWGPLQRAHNLYKRYLKQSGRTADAFEYDVAIARSTGAAFTVPTKTVRKMLRVYRVFEQLRLRGHAVRDDHFSLLDVALASQVLGYPYFGQDEESFLLNDLGLSRFDRLCLRDGCSITNPKHFGAFAKIVENGTPEEVALVEAGGQDPLDVLRRVEKRQERFAFLGTLTEIREALEGLSITDFQGSDEEKGEITKICTLVEKRLKRLAR